MKSFDPRSGIGSADIDTFDFTRCERPDGTAYGTSGKCRQGTESAKQLDQRIARQVKWLQNAKVRGQIPASQIAIERQELERLKEKRAAMNTGSRSKAEQEKAAAETLERIKKEGPKTDVDRKSYSWGDLVTVSKGNEYKAILHPEHQDKLNKLPDKGVTTFKDEQGHKWTVTRDGDTLRLNSKAGKLEFDRGNLEPKAKDTGKSDTAGVKSGLDKLSEADKKLNQEIRASQKRAAQLERAQALVFKAKQEVKNRMNKADRGFKDDDPKDVKKYAQLLKAEERIKKVRNENIRFRQKLEDPLRDQLKKQGEDLERLASEIRRQEGPARAQQMDNIRAKVREIQQTRKRLNEGPGFAPDLGGKGGEPINVSKLYDSLDID